MYSRVNYTIVGIFVLLFGAGLVGFIFWLAKYGIENQYRFYKIYTTESISGLSKDSIVRLHGVDVGHISAIRIDPDNIERIEIRLKIRSDVPMKEDMVAHTEMLGITGLLAIDIAGGSNSAKPLKGKEGEIPEIPMAPSWLKKTTKGIGNLAVSLNDLLQRAQRLMSDQNLAAFSHILANSERFSGEAVEALHDFNTTMQFYKASVKKLNDDIHSISHDFTRITDNTVPLLTSFGKTTKNFNHLTLEAEKTLKRGDYNIKETFEPMLVDIGILTEQLTDLTRALQQNPSSLLFNSRKRRGGPGE